MRFGVRSKVQINLSFGFSREDGSASNTSDDKVLYQQINLSPGTLMSGKKVVKKIRQRFPKLPPFKIREKTFVRGTSLSFGIDQAMSNCRSHATFLHVGLQGSRFNICCYHQYMHQELIFQGLRQELHSKPPRHPRPPTHCASCNNN